MNRLALADTRLVVAYLDPDDQHHAWAVEQFKRFPSFLTCEAVVAEACYLAERRMDGAARVMGLLRVGALTLGYSLRGDETNVAALMAKYADVPMDFADACLVRMTEQHANCEVVTVDGDFLIYRRHGNQEIDVALPRGPAPRPAGGCGPQVWVPVR